MNTNPDRIAFTIQFSRLDSGVVMWSGLMLHLCSLSVMFSTDSLISQEDGGDSLASKGVNMS